MLSLCICTRNRPVEVQRCVDSLVRLNGAEAGDEIVIIDDGDTPEQLVETLRSRASAAGLGFIYHRKLISDGLYASRRVAASIVTGDVVVFLDDDVEVRGNFLSQLRTRYEQDPSLMGVGAVDVAPGASILGHLYCRFFLIAGGNPGRLSVTGFSGSAYQWRHQSRPFDTEFLAGFCMSYRLSAISCLEPVPWLVGYSLSEDLVVSKQAGHHGRLMIDPDLKVVHHRSRTNRWNNVKLRSESILLAGLRLQMLRPTTVGRVLIHWSILGQLIQPLLTLRWREFSDTLRALLAHEPMPKNGPVPAEH